MTEPADHAEPARSGAMRRPLGWRPALLVALVAVLAWGTDQVTKYFAVEHLTRGERVDLIGSAFGLRLVSNPGAAFSMATGSTWIFTIIASVVALVIIRMSGRLGSMLWGLAFGLLLGGAVGNLTDRLFREPAFARGHVIDFLEFPHWPIFNVADCCVTSAAVLIALLTFLGIGIDGHRISEPGPVPSKDTTGAESSPDV